MSQEIAPRTLFGVPLSLSACTTLQILFGTIYTDCMWSLLHTHPLQTPSPLSQPLSYTTTVRPSIFLSSRPFLFVQVLLPPPPEPTSVWLVGRMRDFADFRPFYCRIKFHRPTVSSCLWRGHRSPSRMTGADTVVDQIYSDIFVAPAPPSMKAIYFAGRGRAFCLS